MKILIEKRIVEHGNAGRFQNQSDESLLHRSSEDAGIDVGEGILSVGRAVSHWCLAASLFFLLGDPFPQAKQQEFHEHQRQEMRH